LRALIETREDAGIGADGLDIGHFVFFLVLVIGLLAFGLDFGGVGQ
jgi:hypothetical protein